MLTVVVSSVNLFMIKWSIMGQIYDPSDRLQRVHVYINTSCLHFTWKRGWSWNNCMKSSERYQAPESHPVVRGSLYWCTRSCAQLAVSKLLWDLYCRNALVGNSSPSFIFFVCVTFPLCPHPFSHPVPRFVHPSMDALCQCWLHPGGCNHIWTGSKCHQGAFSPPICISPICWQGPWRAAFSIAQASKKKKGKKTTLMLHLISPDHSWLLIGAWGGGGVGGRRGRKEVRLMEAWRQRGGMFSRRIDSRVSLRLNLPFLLRHISRHRMEKMCC